MMSSRSANNRINRTANLINTRRFQIQGSGGGPKSQPQRPLASQGLHNSQSQDWRFGQQGKSQPPPQTAQGCNQLGPQAAPGPQSAQGLQGSQNRAPMARQQSNNNDYSFNANTKPGQGSGFNAPFVKADDKYKIYNNNNNTTQKFYQDEGQIKFSSGYKGMKRKRLNGPEAVPVSIGVQEEMECDPSCICDRPSKKVLCTVCGTIINESRISIPCPSHPNVKYLMDLFHCKNKGCVAPINYLTEL